jgi:hypothetical protein
MAGGSTPSILQVQKRPDDVIVKALTCDGAEDSPADDGKETMARTRRPSRSGQRGGGASPRA